MQKIETIIYNGKQWGKSHLQDLGIEEIGINTARKSSLRLQVGSGIWYSARNVRNFLHANRRWLNSR